MFRPNSGRPGMPFTYSLPGTTPSAPPSKPLVFRAPVSTYHPVDYHRVPEPTKCRLDGKTILDGMATGVGGGVVTGGMVGGPPGALAGVLPGLVGGALGGAYMASSDKRKCDLEEKKERARNYLKSRGL